MLKAHLNTHMKLWDTHIRTSGLIYGKDINVYKYLEKMEGTFGSLCEKNVTLNIVLLPILKHNGTLKIVRNDILSIYVKNILRFLH